MEQGGLAAGSDPMAAGFELGRRRAARNGLEVPDKHAAAGVGILREVLAPEAENLTLSFTFLFAEQFGIASAARYHFEQEQIPFEEVKAYLEASIGFFNGFTRP